MPMEIAVMLVVEIFGGQQLTLNLIIKVSQIYHLTVVPVTVSASFVQCNRRIVNKCALFSHDFS